MDKIQTLLSQISLLSKKNNEILEIMGTRFNIFHILGVSHYENTHSTILAELLNPEGTHGLHNSFLKLFLDINQIEGFDSRNALVRTEVAVSEYGRIDILVNNAGITKDGLLMAMSEADFDDVIDTNLKGCFQMIRFASRRMMKQRYGRIINVSSVSGVAGNAGQANYSASKAGIIGLTKSAAKELASRGITCNAIAPGFILTDMTAALSDEVRAEWAKKIPLRRGGTPEDVANIATFLASDMSSYVSGQVIQVDGGMNM